MKASNQRTNFFRIRYLGLARTFAALTKSGQQRYAQPVSTGVKAYFPRNLQGLDWPTVIGQPATPIVITEGELKSSSACKLGFPTIGLGGVYSFRSAKSGVLLLPELESINWQERTTYLVFDSDYQDNPQVCRALYELAETLVDQGALPFLVTLPDVLDDGKTGLDDFLASRQGSRKALASLSI